MRCILAKNCAAHLVLLIRFQLFNQSIPNENYSEYRVEETCR